MSHSPTRIAASALLGVAASACLVSVPAPAQAATPSKNTTYRAEINDPIYEITGSVVVKIGQDKHRVAKVTVKLSCAEGKQKMVARNIKIDGDGSFIKQTGKLFPTSQIDGRFMTKHQILGGVLGKDAKPCGGTYLQYVAKD